MEINKSLHGIIKSQGEVLYYEKIFNYFIECADAHIDFWL